MKRELRDIKIGDVLHKAVYYGNNVLLEAGETLDENRIQKLKKFGILSVDIEGNSVIKEKKETIEDVLKKESELKKGFTTDYNNAINSAEDIVNKLESGVVEEEKIDNIIEETINNIAVDSNIILSLLESSKDKSFIFQHTINSLVISMVIGKAMDYSDEKLKTLGKGAFFHDIGMLKVGDEILQKKNKLTEEEKTKIRNHINFGLELAGNNVEKDVKDIIKYHHERMDGSGYPEGLKGEKIPEMARVVAIADIYAALTGDRNYRERYDHYDAMKIVMQSSANLIDASILKKFLKYMPIYPINSYVYLNGNRSGKVVKANENPFRPVIDIEENGKIVRIDLMDEENKKYYISGVKK